jgi:hypothetical protein
MVSEDGDEEEEEEEEEYVEKRTTRGKGKEKEKEVKKTKGGWTKVGGEGRCPPCIREDTECRIDLAAIEKWREDFREGVFFRQHPAATKCERCSLVRKKACPLPATREMREGLPATRGLTVKGGRGGSVTPSAASSSKRKVREVVEVVMPPKKRLRTTTAMTQEGFWAEVIRLMEASEARAVESSRAAVEREERLRAAITLVGTNVMQQNRILLRLEERLQKMAKDDEEEEGDDEDEDEDDDVVEVPIFDATAVEDGVEKTGDAGKE